MNLNIDAQPIDYFNLKRNEMIEIFNKKNSSKVELINDKLDKIQKGVRKVLNIIINSEIPSTPI